MKPVVIGLATGLALGLSSACLADDLVAEQRFTDTGVGFDLKGSYRNVTLTVAGPKRFHASASAENGAPSIDLLRNGPLEDGTYTYQLTAATAEKEKIRTPLDNGRPGGPMAERLKSVATSGTFNVKGGAIVKRDTAAQSGKRDQDRK